MCGKLMIRLFGQLRNKASKSHFGLRRAEKGYIDMFYINVPYIEYTTVIENLTKYMFLAVYRIVEETIPRTMMQNSRKYQSFSVKYKSTHLIHFYFWAVSNN